VTRVLVIAPHPDDEVIGCGGTLRAHVLRNDPVKVVFVTSGEAGGHGIDYPREVREREAREAAEIIGLSEFEFWRARDGAVRATGDLVERVRQELERWSPDVLYLPHGREQHPDHRAVWRIARRALKSGNRPCCRTFELWTPLEHIEHVVDISAHIDTKLAAIRAYKSQCDILRFDDAFRGLARYRGEMFSWPEGDYAEIFGAMSV
jgi:LmbE family N-acetylglucosaminyl deacetylase